MSDTLRIAQAVEFAAIKHASQRRKDTGETPYINHLAAVATNVAKATNGQDAALIIAAYLHDCIEDCSVTRSEIVEAFGAEVADLVAEATDDKSLPKDERKSLQIEHAPHKSARAKLLKLADLVANMTDMIVLMQLPNAGDDLQAIKKGVLELADLVVINKADIDADAATLVSKPRNSWPNSMPCSPAFRICRPGRRFIRWPWRSRLPPVPMPLTSRTRAAPPTSCIRCA